LEIHGPHLLEYFLDTALAEDGAEGSRIPGLRELTLVRADLWDHELEELTVWLGEAIFESPLERVNFINCRGVQREEAEQVWARHGLSGIFEGADSVTTAVEQYMSLHAPMVLPRSPRCPRSCEQAERAP
jgi:hypothetical protein